MSPGGDTGVTEDSRLSGSFHFQFPQLNVRRCTRFSAHPSARLRLNFDPLLQSGQTKRRPVEAFWSVAGAVGAGSQWRVELCTRAEGVHSRARAASAKTTQPAHLFVKHSDAKLRLSGAVCPIREARHLEKVQ